jgi:transposase
MSHSVTERKLTRLDLHDFLDLVCRDLLAKEQAAGACILLAECPLHTEEDLEDLRRRFEIPYIFLPPHSPQLNASQGAFTSMKEHLRRSFTRLTKTTIIYTINKNALHDCSRNSWVVKTNDRTLILGEALAEAIRGLSVPLIEGYCHQVVSEMAKCLNREDI